MKRLLRKWARKFFEKQIRVYQISSFVSNLDLLLTHNRQAEKYHEHELVRKLIEKIYEEKMVEFEQEDDYKTGGSNLRARIRVI